jgi:hypothetical protein
MTNNAADTVPVQSAIRGYIDKRLGLDHSGNNVPVPNLIGPGYLPLSGALAMKGNLNQGGYKIQNLGAPSVDDDATTKIYVDQRVGLYDQLSKQDDVEVFVPASADLLVFTGGGTNAISATASGDITATLTSTNSTTLIGGITNLPTVDDGIAGTTSLYVNGGIVVDDITGFPTSGYIRINAEVFKYTSITEIENRFEGITRAELTSVGATHAASATVIGLSNAQIDLQINPLTIVDADVSETAAIKQSKLDMDDATANTALAAVKGIASFDSANFETDGGGFVSIKAGGVALTEIANIGNGSILGNFTGSATSPQELTATTVGTKSLEALFTSNGALTRTSSETFAVVGITTVGANNSLVKTSGTGTIDVKGLAINGNSVLSIASTTINISTPGGVNIISAVGSNDAATPVTVLGQWTLGANATLAATFADLAEYYTADKEYASGTVLIFGGDAETTTTTIFGDTRLAGVVSTDPGLKMNEGLTGTRVCLALQGRVPCKVVGKVKKGDMLTTAGIAGHAAKAIDPKVGTIIGKALEDKDYTEAGVIEVAVGRV